MQPTLAPYYGRLSERPAWKWHGRVVQANGQTIESEGPPCFVGECCEVIDSAGSRHHAEVIGFRGPNVLAMPLGSTQGIRYGDALAALGATPQLPLGQQMTGRVLDALGTPLDCLPPFRATKAWPLDGIMPKAMEREPIHSPMATGVRALDAMLTVGRGQRIGIFGGSGVGKSTLVGMMTRNTAADITVVGLVGERGREVREFLQDALGEEGRSRSVVLVSTSDESPLLRMRAALAATSVAEYFASQGKHVLLVLDSLTRYAMAAREVGLAAGEPPASKGYTPSVFSRLARLVERAGNFQCGSITAFYTVLMEGDDQQDPIVDAVRSLLDGHVVLSRAMASEGWFPAINVLDSISRLMPAVASAAHLGRAALIRRLLAAYARSEDLIRIGAYKPGTDPEIDQALDARGDLRSFLMQHASDRAPLSDTIERLLQLRLGK